MSVPNFLLLAIFAAVALAKVTLLHDLLSYDNDSPHWQFLGRFCYWMKGGTFEVDVQVDAEWQRYQTFCFYSDYDAQWGITYDHRDVLTCAQKNDNAARCVNVTDIDKYFDGHYHLTIKSSVPRWWFVTISNCYADPAFVMQGNQVTEGQKPSNIEGSTVAGETRAMTIGFMEVKVAYLNPDDGYGKWKVQWSKNEQSIPQQAIGFLVFDVILMVLIVYSKGVAKRTGRSYEILKLTGISVAFTSANLFCKVIHYSIYDDDGIGAPGLETFAFLLEGIAQAVFIGVLIDVSRGYTISTNFIASRKYTYLALFVYMVLHVLVLVWDRYVTDPAEVLYLYESPPGICLMILRVLMLVYMLKNYNETYGYEQKQTRRSFFQMMAGLTFVVMITPPIACLAGTYMNNWDRTKMLFALINGMNTVYYGTMFFIFRPWDGNRFIKVLDPMESKAFGTNNMQVFPEAKNFDEF